MSSSSSSDFSSTQQTVEARLQELEAAFVPKPEAPRRAKKESDRDWKLRVARYRSAFAEYRLATSRSVGKPASPAKPEPKPSPPKDEAPVSFATPRSELLRQGDLSAALPAVHRSAKKRKIEAKATVSAWRDVAAASKKTAAAVRKLTPMQMQTNPTRARLTGEAAKAVALAKRVFKQAEARENERRYRANLLRKEAERQAFFDTVNSVRPERVRIRFPPAGVNVKHVPRGVVGKHKPISWADDDATDEERWVSRHGFSRVRSPSHQLQCKLGDVTFWAGSEDDVTTQTPTLEPSRWRRVRGVLTYHGTLPGGIPVTRPPPTHTTSSTSVSPQLVSYVNVAKDPRNQQAYQDPHFAWLATCPDVVLLCAYGPFTDDYDKVCANRVLKSLCSGKPARPSRMSLPFTDPLECSPKDVGLWCGKSFQEPEIPYSTTRTDAFPVQLTIVCNGVCEIRWISSITIAPEIWARYSRTYYASLGTTPDGPVIVVQGLLLGGSPVPRDPRESNSIRVRTPGGTRTVHFETIRERNDWYHRVLDNGADIVVRIDGHGIFLDIIGRLPGGGGPGDNASRSGPGNSSSHEGADVPRSGPGNASSREGAVPEGVVTHGKNDKPARGTMKTALPADKQIKRNKAMRYQVKTKQDQTLTGAKALAAADAAMAGLDSLKTDAAAAKNSITASIAKQLMTVKAHTVGEPDYDDISGRWFTKFVFDENQWFFDSRRTEEDRIVMMTICARKRNPSKHFRKFFHMLGDEDQHIKDQVHFGWGARNYREFGNDQTQISCKKQIPRAPNVNDYRDALCIYCWRQSQDLPTAQMISRFYFAENTVEDMQALRDFTDKNADLKPPDETDFQILVQKVAKAFGKALFVPKPPELPPTECIEEITETYRNVMRYSTSMYLEDPPMVFSTSTRRDLRLRAHLVFAKAVRLIETFGQGLARAVDGFVDHLCPRTHTILNPLLRVAAKLAACTIPLIGGFAGAAFTESLARDQLPVCGIQLHSEVVARVSERMLVSQAESFNPRFATCVLSPDIEWVQDMSMDFLPDGHVETGRIAVASPLALVAHALTNSMQAQVKPDENDGLTTTGADVRPEMKRGHDLKVLDVTIIPYRIGTFSDCASAGRDILVAQELFDAVVENYARYQGLVGLSTSRDDKIRSAVTHATSNLAKNFNIPITPCGYRPIELDTALAATIAIWSLLSFAGGPIASEHAVREDRLF